MQSKALKRRIGWPGRRRGRRGLGRICRRQASGTKPLVALL